MLPRRPAQERCYIDMAWELKTGVAVLAAPERQKGRYLAPPRYSALPVEMREARQVTCLFIYHTHGSSSFSR